MAVKALQVVLGEMLAVVLLLPGDAGYRAMICCYWWSRREGTSKEGGGIG